MLSVCWAAAFFFPHKAQAAVSWLLLPLQIFVLHWILGQWLWICPAIFLHKVTYLVFHLAWVKGSCQACCPVSRQPVTDKGMFNVLGFPQSDSHWDLQKRRWKEMCFFIWLQDLLWILSILTCLLSCAIDLLSSLYYYNTENLVWLWCPSDGPCFCFSTFPIHVYCHLLTVYCCTKGCRMGSKK